MPTVTEIIAFVEGRVGHGLNSDEGVQHGSPTGEVRRALVCWMATRDALEQAGRTGCQLVIGHESLYYPYGALRPESGPSGWQDWRINAARRDLLERHGLTFARLHGSLDELCIFDEFARILGLGEPVQADGLAKVYEVKPCTLRELVERVKERTRTARLRVTAPQGMEQRVRRVGLPWGGLGLFVNVSYQQELLEMGCDVLIAGESDSYGFRFAAEHGVPMIETSHEGSENPGLRRFCALLKEQFATLAVHFHEVPPSWQWG
jgi:putative NIF3 family GTP cyclohydrolase 1 type 2